MLQWILFISCILILATCALVLETIVLHPLSSALAIRTKSTEALRYFDKILAINPKNVTALTNKGIALNYLANHTGAILYYDKALVVDPNNIRALNDKGIALNYLRNFTQAIQSFDKALAIDPKNVRALTNKGSALGALGKNRWSSGKNRCHVKRCVTS